MSSNKKQYLSNCSLEITSTQAGVQTMFLYISLEKNQIELNGTIRFEDLFFGKQIENRFK